MTGLPSIDLRVERWSLLAGLRFALACIVAVNHLAEYTDPGALSIVYRLGAFEAVLGFLLISGYSIAHSYHAAPSGYFARRARRIYPVYLAALASLVLVFPLPPIMDAGVMIALNLVFLNQVLTAPSMLGPAWSLALEVWLYLLAPWFSRRSQGVLWAIVAASLLAYTVHTVGRTLWHWPYYSGLSGGLNLPLLAFAWIAGWLLARHPGRRAFLRVVAILGLHILLAALIQLGHRLKHGQGMVYFGDLLDYGLHFGTLLAVWTALLIAAQRTTGDAVSPSPALRFLGDVSYPLYLLHVPLFKVLCDAGVGNPYVILGVTVAVCAAAHLVLETPILPRALRTFTAPSARP